MRTPSDQAAADNRHRPLTAAERNAYAARGCLIGLLILISFAAFMAWLGAPALDGSN